MTPSHTRTHAKSMPFRSKSYDKHIRHAMHISNKMQTQAAASICLNVTIYIRKHTEPYWWRCVCVCRRALCALANIISLSTTLWPLVSETVCQNLYGHRKSGGSRNSSTRKMSTIHVYFHTHTFANNLAARQCITGARRVRTATRETHIATVATIIRPSMETSMYLCLSIHIGFELFCYLLAIISLS